MITLKLMMSIILMVVAISWMTNYAFGETRTLTTRLIITVKSPDTGQAAAPVGMQEIYNAALAQSQANRFVKIEDPMYAPGGISRYTMSEKL